MRILDKYLLREFSLPLVYCFDAFTMLWVVQDLLANLGEFIDAKVTAARIVKYYLLAFPEALVMILPISLLLAVLFCLSNLGRHNELVALRASGISLARLAAPLLAVALVATAVVFAVTQSFVPQSKEKTETFLRDLRNKGRPSVRRNFYFNNQAENRDWFAHEFDVSRQEMTGAEVTQAAPDGRLVLKVYAQQARWQQDHWEFFDVVVYNCRQLPEVVTRAAVTNFPAFKEPPSRLELEGKRPEHLTAVELRRYVRALKRANSTSRLAAYEVELHYRYALPLTSLMVLWLGVPLGLRISRSGPLRSVGVALLLVVAFYILTHFSIALGKGGWLPPVVAAWLTNAIFAGVGAVLLFRAR